MNKFKKIVRISLIFLLSAPTLNLFAQEAQSSWVGMAGKVFVGAGGAALSALGFGAGYFFYRPMQKNRENMSKLTRSQVNFRTGRYIDSVNQNDQTRRKYNEGMKEKIPNSHNLSPKKLARMATGFYADAARDYNKVQRRYDPNSFILSANQVSENSTFIRQASELKLKIEHDYAEYFADSQQRTQVLAEKREEELQEYDSPTDATIKAYDIAAAKAGNSKKIAYGIGFLGAITAVCSLKSLASK